MCVCGAMCAASGVLMLGALRGEAQQWNRHYEKTVQAYGRQAAGKGVVPPQRAPDGREEAPQWRLAPGFIACR